MKNRITNEKIGKDEKTRNNWHDKGITLITLVITIILLIILAGIVINLSLKENGILKKAKEATNDYEMQAMKEELELDIIDIQEKILQEQNRTANLIDLENELNREKYEVQLKYDILQSEETPIYAIVRKIGTNYQFIVDTQLIINDVRNKILEEPNVEIETQEDVQLDIFKIKVKATIKEGKITEIKAMNGAKLINDISDEEKEYYVSKNGAYIFKITADNGTEVMKKVNIEDIKSSPEIQVSVYGKTLLIKILHKYDTANIEKYTYYADGQAIKTTTANNCSIYLNGSTKYKIKGTITLKGGIEKETNELETQTEERLYLYSKGNKYTDITGGYTFKVIKNNDASYQDNSQYMYIYGCSRSGVGYGELELYSNKTVNVDTYKKMYIDMDYQVVYGEANWRCHFYYGLQGGKIIDVPGINS